MHPSFHDCSPWRELCNSPSFCKVERISKIELRFDRSSHLISYAMYWPPVGEYHQELRDPKLSDNIGRRTRDSYFHLAMVLRHCPRLGRAERNIRACRKRKFYFSRETQTHALAIVYALFRPGLCRLCNCANGFDLYCSVGRKSLETIEVFKHYPHLLEEF